MVITLDSYGSYESGFPNILGTGAQIWVTTFNVRLVHMRNKKSIKLIKIERYAF